MVASGKSQFGHQHHLFAVAGAQSKGITQEVGVISLFDDVLPLGQSRCEWPSWIGAEQTMTLGNLPTRGDS